MIVDCHVHACATTPDHGSLSPRLRKSLTFRFTRWRLGIAGDDDETMERGMEAKLVETVATARPDDALACSGPGLRSVTRLAAGAPELWTEILSLNRVAVKTALHHFAAQLERFAECLEPGSEAALAALLRSAAARRRELPQPGQSEA